MGVVDGGHKPGPAGTLGSGPAWRLGEGSWKNGAMATAATLSTPQCAAHPTQAAGAVCRRCGSFCCDACATPVLGELFCPACAALPAVSYLEAFRLRLWGRRDPWAWLLGLGGVMSLALGVGELLSGEPWRAAVFPLLNAGVGFGYFLRQRWARWALLAQPLVMGAVAVLDSGEPMYAVPYLMLLGFAFIIVNDSRSKLFFRIPLSPPRLRQLWDVYENNLVARLAFTLGLFGLVLPFFAPVALALGVVGLRRVDPDARPPIGRKWQALAGICLGVAAPLLWAWVLLP